MIAIWWIVSIRNHFLSHSNRPFSNVEKILIIDDSDGIRIQTATALQFENYQVFTAADGLEGLQLAHSEKPDLILCDIDLPRLDGYYVLERLRSSAEFAKMCFVFLTGKNQPEEIKKMMLHGADAYIAKPFSLEELFGIVKIQLQKRKQDRLRHDIFQQFFTTNFPHELRTPLTGIISSTFILDNGLRQFRGHNTTLDENIMGLDEFEQAINAIRSSAERLKHIAESFLILSSIQSIAANPEEIRRLRAKVTEGGIKDITTSIFFNEANKFERSKDDIVIDMEESEIAMSSEHIYLLLREIASNTLKFSQNGTPIYIEGRLQQQNYVLTIQDNGIGMREEDIANIGVPFRQLGRQEHEQQGVGLGLAIVKTIGEIYGHTISFYSKPGAGFTISLLMPSAPIVPE